MAQDQQKHLGERRMPSWLALLLILLLGSAASWGIWKLMSGPAPKVEAVAVTQPVRDGRGGRKPKSGMISEQGRRAMDQMRRNGPTTNPSRQAIGIDRPRRALNPTTNPSQRVKVFKRPEGGIRLIGESHILYVDPKDKGGEIKLEYIDPENWLSRQQLTVLRIAEGAQDTVRTVELTEAQREQSKVVISDPVIPLDAADRSKLDQLARAWDLADDAQKPAAQNALMAGLREVAKKNIKTARQGYLANIEKLAAMLTPQQIEQYRQTQGGTRRGRNG